MNHNKSELYFLLILLAGIFILTFFIFKPFLFALILAIVFATVFEPLHKKALIITRERRSLAALLATVSVLIIVVVPITFLGIQIFQEATQLYSSLTSNGGANNLSHSVENAIQNLKTFIPIPIDFSFDINQYVKQGLNWLLQHLGSVFSNVAKIIMSVFIFLVALYCLFKNGPKLKKTVIALSPLQNIHDETILGKLNLAINSVVKGSLVVAFVQGILATIGFIIFGVPNAMLWGSVTVISALIPSVGTSLIVIPAVLFLFLSGKTLFAIGLLIWGLGVVGLIDNFLRPKLVERGMKLHPFLILLSILGGIGFFGPLGFLLGPLVLSLLLALLEIYFAISKEHESNI